MTPPINSQPVASLSTSWMLVLVLLSLLTKNNFVFNITFNLYVSINLILRTTHNARIPTVQRTVVVTMMPFTSDCTVNPDMVPSVPVYCPYNIRSYPYTATVLSPRAQASENFSPAYC
jgi:hypothetical protein